MQNANLDIKIYQVDFANYALNFDLASMHNVLQWIIVVWLSKLLLWYDDQNDDESVGGDEKDSNSQCQDLVVMFQGGGNPLPPALVYPFLLLSVINRVNNDRLRGAEMDIERETSNKRWIFVLSLQALYKGNALIPRMCSFLSSAVWNCCYCKTKIIDIYLDSLLLKLLKEMDGCCLVGSIERHYDIHLQTKSLYSENEKNWNWSKFELTLSFIELRKSL